MRVKEERDGGRYEGKGRMTLMEEEEEGAADWIRRARKRESEAEDCIPGK